MKQTSIIQNNNDAFIQSMRDLVAKPEGASLLAECFEDLQRTAPIVLLKSKTISAVKSFAILAGDKREIFHTASQPDVELTEETDVITPIATNLRLS